jgi:hypothetical protein
MTEKAKTYDEGKAPLAYLPWAAIDAVALVQSYGHKKYGDFYNYRKGMEVGRNLSCALRHIRDYMNGADVDHESGINPLAHAITRLAFVIQNLQDGTAIDDRYKKDPAPQENSSAARHAQPLPAIEGVSRRVYHDALYAELGLPAADD